MSVAPSIPALARICTMRIPPRSNASMKPIGSTASGSNSAYTPRSRARTSPLTSRTHATVLQSWT
jgi:hypothetical protein